MRRHRDYQANMPTRLYQYDHHIEIMNPGGLYGQARPENFPHVNDYRNSVVAEMMKNLNYVNMFNHGVSEVQDLLKENQSPAAEFNVNLVTAFSVIVREPEAAENMQKVAKTGQKVELSQVCPKLSQVVPSSTYKIFYSTYCSFRESVIANFCFDGEGWRS